MRKLAILIAVIAVMFGFYVEMASANVVLIIDKDSDVIIKPRPPRPIPQPIPRPIYVPPQQQNIYIKSQIIDTTVDKQIATTTIDQVFHNPNNRVMEGEYLLPLPDDMNVNDFSLFMNGKEVMGSVLDANQARAEYERIVRSMKDPGLLEYVNHKLIKCRIFPIPARGDFRIKIKMTGPLKIEDEVCRFYLPLKTNHYSKQFVQNQTINVKMKSDIPIKNIFSTTHQVMVDKKDNFEATVSFEAEKVYPDRNFECYFSFSKEDIGINLVNYKQKGSDGCFMLMISPGKELRNDKIVDKDIVFVMDTSGSMNSYEKKDERTKLDKAKEALSLCLNSLNKGDRFNVITFSSRVSMFSKELLEADHDNVKNAQEFVKKATALGGTNIYGALEEAMGMVKPNSNRPFQVIFITDGKPTIGDFIDPNQILENVKKINNKNVRIFPVGVGFDLNTFLIDKLAESNGGTRIYIAPNEDIELKIASLYNRISYPALVNVSLSFDKNIIVEDYYPQKLPDLFAGSQITVFGRYRGSGEKLITLTGEINGKKREIVYEAKFDEENLNNVAIPKIWAERKVAYLLDQIRINGMKQEVKDEIVHLCKTYGIISPYTSWLIVEPGRSQPGAPAPRVFEDRIRKEMAADSKAKQYQESQASEFKGQSGKKSVDISRELNKLRDQGHGNNFAELDDEEGMMKNEKDMPEVFRRVARRYRNIGVRNFYQDGDLWIDTELTDKDGKVIKIKFLSDEYFEFLKKYPELKEVLSLGKNIKLLQEDKVYEITE